MLQHHVVARIGVVCLLGLATPLRSVAAQEARVPCEPDAGDQAAAPELMFNLVRHNFEPSYMAYPFALSGLPPLLVEANVAPHFTVGRTSWPLAFVLTPKIVVRMFRARSTPVHTPSYMPRAALFAWLKHDLEPNAATAYASLAISHHSNGEDGPAVDAAGRSNHTSGDFSTNFLELAVYETRSRARLFGWNKLALEYHLGFNQSAHLANRYGLVRLEAATTVLETSAPVEGILRVQVTAILDTFQRQSHSAFLRAAERFPLAVQYAVKIPGIDLGGYVGYYIGHDYYNIWFDRVIHTFQIGLAGSVGPVLVDQPEPT